MASNRMWLVNRQLKIKALIGKYYPSTGWYTPNGATQRINKAMEMVERRTEMGDDLGWELVFENQSRGNELEHLLTITSEDL